MDLVRADLPLVWRHFIARNRPLPPIEYRLTVELVMSGRVWAGCVCGAPVAIGGVRVFEHGLPGTAWLSVLPEAAAGIVPATLLMRRVIRDAETWCRPGVVCVVEEWNDKGARLARCLGFSPTDRRIGSLVEWGRESGNVGDRRRHHGARSQEAGGAGRTGTGDAGGGHSG